MTTTLWSALLIYNSKLVNSSLFLFWNPLNAIEFQKPKACCKLWQFSVFFLVMSNASRSYLNHNKTVAEIEVSYHRGMKMFTVVLNEPHCTISRYLDLSNQNMPFMKKMKEYKFRCSFK
ncbi:hypothetical protein VPH35_109955 [Triticum aestivum]